VGIDADFLHFGCVRGLFFLVAFKVLFFNALGCGFYVVLMAPATGFEPVTKWLTVTQ